MQSNPINRKAIALIVIVFLLGIAIGAVGHSLADRRVFGAGVRPAGGPPGLVPRMTHELDLSADQQQKLTQILTDMKARFDAVHQQMNPQFEQIRNEGHDQIRQLLTPDQRPKFETFLQQLTEERKRRNSNR